MIIIEGPDNAGKTTLVRQLIELDPKLRLLKRDRFRPENGETIATSYMESLLPKDGDRVAHGYSIADRMLASECIYGDLFRGGCRMTPGEHAGIRGLLLSYSAIIVHCDVPNNVVLRNWQSREQMYDDPLAINMAYRRRFEEVFRTSELTFRYDWTAPHAESTREAIIRAHVAVQKNVMPLLSWWSGMPFGVGQLRKPKLIIVGESLSPSARTPVPFTNGPAGDFLIESLEAIGVDMKTVYITNARKGGDRDEAILREELNFLAGEDTTVLLLGREAEKVFEYVEPSLNVVPAVARVPHPSYWRRFRSNESEKYSQLISRVLED